MNTLLILAFAAWLISGPATKSFQEGRANQELMNCQSSSNNSEKTQRSANYETLVDFEYHSDDQYIRCQKPIRLRNAMRPAVNFTAINQGLEKLSKRLANDPRYNKRAYIVYSYARSQAAGRKISSIFKTQLSLNDLVTLEHEPDPLGIKVEEGDLDFIAGQCDAGEFASGTVVSRIFAVQDELNDAVVKVGLCQGKTWEVLI